VLGAVAVTPPKKKKKLLSLIHLASLKAHVG